MSTDIVTSSATGERLTGRVKWFNNKAGYGFITVTDGARSGTDIFVHHSSVQVENQQYKYLVQGEYVEFELSNTPSGNHEFQASNVAGINKGKLMCETRREFKIARTTYKSSKDDEDKNTTSESNERVSQPRQPVQSRAPRVRGEGPREGGDKDGFTIVKSKNTSGRGRGRPARSTQESH